MRSSQPGARGVADDLLGIDALVHRRSRAAAVLLEIDDADAAVRLERLGEVAQQRDRLLDLVIRVDDQHGVERLAGSFGSVGVPSTVFTRFCRPSRSHAALDRLDHLRLDVFGVDLAVRTDAARQAHGEPAAAGAEVGDDAAVADLERVHDLIGPLPRVAIRTLEQAEVLRRKQPRVLRRQTAPRAERQHEPARRPLIIGPHCRYLIRIPGMPGEVIASGERIASS